MKANEQIIRTDKSEIGMNVEAARSKVMAAQYEAMQVEQEASNMEIELMKAEAARQERNEAELRVESTSEKINEAVG